MSETFLPGINRRYLGSFVGLFHALSSISALVIGNYLFLQCFLLGNDILASSEEDNSSILPTIFHVTTGLSGECSITWSSSTLLSSTSYVEIYPLFHTQGCCFSSFGNRSNLISILQPVWKIRVWQQNRCKTQTELVVVLHWYYVQFIHSCIVTYLMKLFKTSWLVKLWQWW